QRPERRQLPGSIQGAVPRGAGIGLFHSPAHRTKPRRTGVSSYRTVKLRTQLSARRRPRCRSRPTAGRAQIAEEVRRRLQHQDIALVMERAAIRLHAAPELRKLRILAKRIGIDLRGLRIAFALDLLRIAI